MSEQFETQLAEWLHDYLRENPAQGGQKLRAEFHDRRTADRFAQQLIKRASDPSRSIPGSDATLPAITEVGGTPLFVARVRADADEVSQPHVITQGFATKLRNLVSASVYEGDAFAMVMILESDATLDTLEASESLFGEEGKLNLTQFRRSVLDPESCSTKQGRALLESLNEVLEQGSAYAEDVGVLNTLCEIRYAINEEQPSELPDLISDLPQFIREDYITEDWFRRDPSQEDLTASATEFLEDNQSHAERLRRAHRTGTNTESKLSSTYEESFINTVQDAASWKEVDHTAAEKRKIERTSIRFRDLEVEADSHRMFSPIDSDATRRGVIAIADEGKARLTAEFSADLEDTPYEFVNSDEEEPSNLNLGKRKNRVTASLDSLSQDEPTYGSLLLYVGKKTTRGQPTHVFNLAVVPQWFYDATEDLSLDVSVSDESVVSNGGGEIALKPPSLLEFDFREEPQRIDVTSQSDQTVPFESELILQPSAPDAVEQVNCLIAPPSEIPIRISFLTEVRTVEAQEVVFPLMLAAIEDPGRWGARKLQLPAELSIDTNRGEIHTGASDGIRFEESDLELIQTEEVMIAEGTPQRRVVDSEDIQAGSVAPNGGLDSHPALQQAYTDLFAHFEERQRTPSTSTWDAETKECVRAVLQRYKKAVAAVGEKPDFSDFEPLRGIGVIDSAKSEKSWLTPFHPVMLAYGYRIAEWRDTDLVPAGAEEGFRTDRYLNRFNPSGLLPYIVSEDGENELLRGLMFEDHPLWGVYSPVESPGSVTPAYMERVIRDKLDTFVKSFPLLFNLHGGRNFVINLVNMGDLRPVIKGLYEFYKGLERTDIDPPQILLRIYGGPAEGEALERFFGDSSKSRLRTQLEQKNDEIVDVLRSNLMYVWRGEYTESSHKEAHMSMFRGLLTEESGITEVGDLPSGMLLDGLLARESIEVQSQSTGTVYSVGFGHDGDADETIVEGVARVANTLEAGRSNNKYLADHTLKKTVKSSRRTDLQKLWDDSLWVVHVQPNVGLEFYIESDNQIASDEGMVMIHYNDQYDSSSPNYDVITSTTQRNPYLTALERALEEAQLSEFLEPEQILSTLIAVDGELALELQRSDEKGVVEKAGFIGGLALSRALLNKYSSQYTWVPLSLNELSRHDRATRDGTDGLLQYSDGGAASDDICMVGVPEDAEQAPLKLWIVETKGGSSALKKGRQQVSGAIGNLESIFHPDSNYSDVQLQYAEFGKTVIDVAKRMASYSVLTDAEIESVRSNEMLLNEGSFDVEFLTDTDGHIGEVVRVRPDTMQTDVDLSNPVRTIDASLDSLKLVDDSTIEEVLSDLNADKLAFDISPPLEPVSPIPQGAPSAQTSGASPTPAGGSNESGSDPSDAGESSPDTSLSGGSTPEHSSDRAGGQIETPDPDGESDGFTLDNESDPAVTPRPSGTDESAPGQGTTGGDAGSEDSGSQAPSHNGSSSGDVPGSDSVDPEPESVSGAGEAPDIAASSILSKMQQSDDTSAEIDRSGLVADLKREFGSLGVDIHPPNPASISVGPRKFGVNVHPKEGQTVEGIIKRLNSLSVHIQADGDIVGTPNPSAGAVRLEIPHSDPTDVYLRRGIESQLETLQGPVTVPLGVDVDNEHHSLSMMTEKHALIGGATGSGKSNFLSSLVASLAITNSPDMCEISILDPKGVDFGRFSDLPHVQAGTYLDTPEACTQYLMDLLGAELQQRKSKLQESGATSVSELNDHADRLGVEPIPYHVIIIDEYADLIMSMTDSEEEFEDAVTRLAQVGRAHGFVIFLATQRPSADIVSGKIKANFPCRISFRLPSNTDSRVILDKPGAEDLGGAGDMIVVTQEGEYRLQGYRLSPLDAAAIQDAYE